MTIHETLDRLLTEPPYGKPQREREAALVPVLADLTRHHAASSGEYRKILDAAYGGIPEIQRIADVPWLPVQLFKTHPLVSVAPDDVFKVLTSSGTTGQAVSRISLDRETALRQTRALAAIMKSLLGPKRRPMLIVDTPTVLKDRRSFSARGAGILGMMNHGRDHTYLLDEQMRPDLATLEAFLDKHGGEPFLIFGFTFMVWQYLYETVPDGAADLRNGVLVHSGGWKKLQEQAVDADEFARRLRERLGLATVRNFYGMVEQVGSVFLEGEDGLLHPPAFADVVVRNPVTWDEQPVGEPGVLQVLSALPTSYPGHSLMTEDLGVVETVDGSSEGGKGFRVLGRVPKTELRGCSDTHAYATASA